MNERMRAITANVQAIDDRAERRAEAQRATLEAHGATLEAHGATLEAHGATLEAQRATLESIARDVSFLAGRQAERDRQAEHASG